MNSKINYKRELENYKIFADKKLSLQKLVEELVETSTLHYQSEWKMDENLNWVLLSWNIKFLELPNIHDTITISTEIIGHVSFFIIRKYSVFNSDGSLLLETYAVWSIIDENTRSIIRLPKDLTIDVKKLKRSELEIYLPTIDLPDIYCTQTFVAPTDDDIDSNNHVNNAVYFNWLEMIIPNFSSDTLLYSTIKVLYKKEILPNEKVRLRFYENSKSFVLEITSKDDEIKALLELVR